MTITQTIEIPADRRITIDIPQTFPVGKARISVFPVADGIGINETKEDSHDEFAAVSDKVITKHIKAFKVLAK